MESKLSLNHFCCNLKALPSLARLISHLFCSGLSIWVSPCVKPEPSVTDDVHWGFWFSLPLWGGMEVPSCVPLLGLCLAHLISHPFVGLCSYSGG